MSAIEGKAMKLFLLLVMSALMPALRSADSPLPAQDPAMVIHLLDYLAKDYGGAVQDGIVVNQFEYQEQLEFTAIIARSAKELDAFQASRQFQEDIAALRSSIANKSEADSVAKLARRLQAQAIRLAKIELAPKSWPDLQEGARIYQENCSGCHGLNGQGDGTAGAELDPAPANFLASDVMLASSPFQYFNTIRLGVPGTGMIAFPQLTDEQVWAIAFYVKSLGHKKSSSPTMDTPSMSLKEVSVKSDRQILDTWSGSHADNTAKLAAIRTYQPEHRKPPFIALAAGLLKQSQNAYRLDDYKAAIQLSLQAYLEGIEPIEAKIKANQASSVQKIEEEFGQYRSLLQQQASYQRLDSHMAQMQQSLLEIDKAIEQSKMSAPLAFGAAYSIFLREGFEAVLIIIVLLSVIRAMDASHASRWVHAGWMLAVSLGIITWVISGAILQLSGYNREMLEATISLLAVLILLYVGFWLHKHSEMKKWQQFLHNKVQSALDSKKLIGLMIISFMAVFREAFEVVLFLRAIWFDLDPIGKTSASFGVIASFVTILGLSYLLIRSSRNLSVKLLFKICSASMAILALILIGKGIHAFQETGILSINPISIELRFDLLGVYPTWETIGAQILVLACILVMRWKVDRTLTAA